MITLFTIGVIVFTVKFIHFVFRASWGITKGVMLVIGIPALLIALFVAGLAALAVLLLALALLTVFLRPMLKRI